MLTKFGDEGFALDICSDKKYFDSRSSFREVEMDPVPGRLAASEELDFDLVEPTAILLEPPEKRIYVAFNHIATVEELVQLTTEAKAGPPEDVRGILIGYQKDREELEAELASGRLIIYECKGHVIYPPEFRSCLFYNAVPETITATLIRKETIRLKRRDQEHG